MRALIGQRLLIASYVLFLAIYVFAAAAFGLTRASSVRVFEVLMGGTLAVWLTAHAVRHTRPNTGWLPWVLAAAVLAFGWIVGWAGVEIETIIAEGRLDEGSSWHSLLATLGALNGRTVLLDMRVTTVLLGAMLMAIELWRDPQWGRALTLTLVLSSFAMVVFFMLQRTVGGPFLLRSEDGIVPLSFGTFRYWGNAAAYLNLHWPLALSVAAYAAVRQTPAWALWLIPAISLFAANFLNVSKAGNVLALLGAGLLAALLAPPLWKEIRRTQIRIRPAYVIGALIPVIIVLCSLPFALPRERWERLAARINSETVDRPAAYREFMKMLPDSGWTGFGPGTFEEFHRAYVTDNPLVERAPFWNAHQDYLQTLVEWGYLGTALWGLVFLPATLALVWRARRAPTRASREFSGYRLTWLDHVRGFIDALPAPDEPWVPIAAVVSVGLTALHALVDFPMQIASLQLTFLVLIALGWSLLGNRSGRRPNAETGDAP